MDHRFTVKSGWKSNFVLVLFCIVFVFVFVFEELFCIVGMERGTLVPALEKVLQAQFRDDMMGLLVNGTERSMRSLSWGSMCI